MGRARRRRLLRQGPDQGRPERRLHRQAGRQEHRRQRPRPPLHRAGVVRHRRPRAALRVRRLLRHRQDPRQGDPQDRQGELRFQARDDDHQPRPQEGRQPVHQDRGVRPFRPRGSRLHMGGCQAAQV
uniref:Uncharacterized protein n=2 Tax=Oryza TaxID=4527 RepID=A0A0E0FL48_ORYNI